MTRQSPRHWLPRLAAGGRGFDLPLAGPTARRLADALLAGCAVSRHQKFRAALAGDPSLAIWAIVRCTARDTCAGPGLDGLAAGLGLEPPESFCRADSTPVAAAHADYGPAAGVALVTARLARRFAREAHEPGLAENAHLLALVHQAPAWLVDVNRPANELEHPNLVLPGWLLDSLARLERPTQGLSPAEQCVSRALRLVCSRNPQDWRAARLGPRRWIDRWRREGEQWSRPSAWSTRFTSLVERLQKLNRLESSFDAALERAKLEAIKEFAYGAGHEINNPLANISARAQTLLQDETDPERRRTLAAINAQAFRAHEMIADMMLFARPPQPKCETFDLAAVLGKLSAELTELAEAQQTEFVVRLPAAKFEIAADPTQIAVAVRSLCANALEALVSGGRVQLELAVQHADAVIRVSDNGPGIPADVRPKIFEPYFSGREAGRGLGLGLSKCWRIVTQHGGRIEVSGHEGLGATFTIMLPKPPPASDDGAR